MNFLQNEVELHEEELDKSSEDHEFNERRGFYSSPPYKPTYHYEPPAYHPPPPPPAYKAVYEVSVSLQSSVLMTDLKKSWNGLFSEFK